MTINQQIRSNYIEEISIKSDAKKKKKIISHQKSYCKHSANSLTMIAKQKIRINYTEKISIKSDAKKIKFYQILKRLL